MVHQSATIFSEVAGQNFAARPTSACRQTSVPLVAEAGRYDDTAAFQASSACGTLSRLWHLLFITHDPLLP